MMINVIRSKCKVPVNLNMVGLRPAVYCGINKLNYIHLSNTAKLYKCGLIVLCLF
jgi:hypothetical protein